MPEDVWKKLAANLESIKKEFKVEGEIKWRYFAPSRPQSKPHSLSHLNAEQKENLRSKLYSAITAYKSIKLICVVCDVRLAYGLPYIKSADDLYWYSYKQLAERFQYYLQDLERTVGQKMNGIVVCDHRQPNEDNRLRELHYQLITSAKTNFSSFGNLIEGLFLAPSHMSVGVQFADMVAGALYRKVKDGDMRFYTQIEKSFRRSSGGKIEGYGIVRFPKK